MLSKVHSKLSDAFALVRGGTTDVTGIAKALGISRPTYYVMESMYPDLEAERRNASSHVAKSTAVSKTAEAVIKELEAGNLSPSSIAAAVGISRQRYYQLEGLHKQIKSRRLELAKAANMRSIGARYATPKRAKDFYNDNLRAEQCRKLSVKKANASKAGVEFALAWEDLEWPSVCPVLGISIDYFSPGGSRNENSCSFDRIDNTLGYVKGNVVVMSWRANRIKNDGSAEEHRKIAEYIDSTSR